MKFYVNIMTVIVSNYISCNRTSEQGGRLGLHEKKNFVEYNLQSIKNDLEQCNKEMDIYLTWLPQ